MRAKAFITKSCSTRLVFVFFFSSEVESGTSCTLKQDLGMKGKLMSCAGDKIAAEKKCRKQTGKVLMVFVSVLWRSDCMELDGRKHFFLVRLIVLSRLLNAHKSLLLLLLQYQLLMFMYSVCKEKCMWICWSK